MAEFQKTKSLAELNLGSEQKPQETDSMKYARWGVSMLVFGAIGYYTVRNKKMGVKIGVTLGSAIIGNMIVGNVLGMYHRKKGEQNLNLK